MTKQSILHFVFASFWVVFAATASAEPRVIGLEEQPRWNAVGRVNKGGFNTLSTCTGTLVAPDLVLTAAHCVPRNDPTPEQLAERKFVAGWNRGEYAAVRSFAAVYVHPENIPGPVNTRTIYTDVALVRLDAPISPDLVAPMRLGALPGPDESVGFLGYRNDRRHAPSLSTGCDHIQPRPHLLFLSCPVVSGNSGGPVLAGSSEDPYIVGVVSAKGAGGAFAAGLQDWMRAYLPDDW